MYDDPRVPGLYGARKVRAELVRDGGVDGRRCRAAWSNG